MIPRLAVRTLAVVALAATVAACATGRAFTRGQEAAKAGDWDAAVAFYRAGAAGRSRPRRTTRSRSSARCWRPRRRTSTRAREFEAANQLEEALREYRKALEYEPTNRPDRAAGGRARADGARPARGGAPRPEIEQLREQARRQSAEPLLNPGDARAAELRFTNASIRDILNFIGNATGINIIYERDFQDRVDHGAARGRHARAGAEPDHDRPTSSSTRC